MPTYVPGLYENKAEVLQRFRYILAMQNHSANLHVRFSGNTIALVAPDGARGDVISSGRFVLGPLITMAQLSEDERALALPTSNWTAADAENSHRMCGGRSCWGTVVFSTHDAGRRPVRSASRASISMATVTCNFRISASA